MFSNISAPLSWQWVRHNQTTELNSVKIQENTHARAHTHYKHQLAIAAVMLCNKETKTLKKRKQISMTLNNFLTPMGDNKRVLFSQGLVWKLGSATCLWFRLLGLQQLKRLSFIFQCFDSAVCVSRSPWINILSRNILPIAMKESQECLSKCVKPRLGCKKKKKKILGSELGHFISVNQLAKALHMAAPKVKGRNSKSHNQRGGCRKK